MKHFKIFSYLLAATLLFASCSDDDDDKNLSFDKDAIEIIVGQTETITVKNAKGVLTILSDKKTASAVVSEDADDKVVITGIAEGETVVTVTDKAGKTDTIKVTVWDASARFVWDTVSKKGKTYILLQDEETGRTGFTWKAEGDEHPIILCFIDENKKLEVGAKKDAKLTINGEEGIAVTSLEIKHSKILKEGAGPTIWIAFKAKDKEGICVATETTFTIQPLQSK